jgi:transposase
VVSRPTPGWHAYRRANIAVFVGLLRQVVRQAKAKRDIHIILDNLSAHKTKKVARFLDKHS